MTTAAPAQPGMRLEEVDTPALILDLDAQGLLDPALVIADEPTGNLDSVNAAAILDLLFELKVTRGVSLVMVSHEPNHARRCDRQVRIKDGKVYEQDRSPVLEHAL